MPPTAPVPARHFPGSRFQRENGPVGAWIPLTTCCPPPARSRGTDQRNPIPSRNRALVRFCSHLLINAPNTAARLRPPLGRRALPGVAFPQGWKRAASSPSSIRHFSYVCTKFGGERGGEFFLCSANKRLPRTYRRRRVASGPPGFYSLHAWTGHARRQTPSSPPTCVHNPSPVSFFFPPSFARGKQAGANRPAVRWPDSASPVPQAPWRKVGRWPGSPQGARGQAG